MNDEKTQAEAALRAATEHYKSVHREMFTAITAEQKKIEARYAPLLEDARDVEAHRKRQLDAINLALSAANPLIGRKVHQRGESRGWRSSAVPELFGVLEAYKPGDDFSGGRPPAAGQIIIRILKKDGTPSMRHKDMAWNGGKSAERELPWGWRFIDTDAAQPKES